MVAVLATRLGLMDRLILFDIDGTLTRTQNGYLPFNDAIQAAGTFNSNFKRWTIGPVVELNLPLGLGVEADYLKCQPLRAWPTEVENRLLQDQFSAHERPFAALDAHEVVGKQLIGDRPVRHRNARVDLPRSGDLVRCGFKIQ